MRKYNCLGLVTEKLISPKMLIDLRLQGLSFSTIADRLHITKSSVYHVYKKYKSAHYDGYCPVSLDAVRQGLNSDAPFTKIAYQLDLSVEGLRNLITDYDIEDRLTVEKARAVMDNAPSFIYIADYFGVHRNTLLKFMKENDLSFKQGVKEPLSHE